ncbi:MAG: hypothetical protein QUV05_00305 [Phycisphaerae bacterium]|nr:hypothetical protein [Phycisphaerae bacterium]
MRTSDVSWTNIGVYSSFTTKDGNNVLWHCDRRCYLVGKRITDQFLADLQVPRRQPSKETPIE